MSTASPAILDRMNLAENNHETTRPGGITGNGFHTRTVGQPGGRPKGLARRVPEAIGENGELVVSTWLRW